MVSRQQEEFRVGRWYVAPLSGTIATLQGKPRHLQPKVMDLLVCLAERAGEPMGRDELIHCIWGERGASDEVLTRTVSELRRATPSTSKPFPSAGIGSSAKYDSPMRRRLR
jgi:DNA-binding winged helix-turn-helix (wHTH) protein